jgi:hypothetical protein
MRFRRRSTVAEAPRAAESPRAAEAPRERAAPTAGPGAPVSRAPVGERPARRGIAWRTRDAGAAAVGAAGAGVVLLARLVMAVATLIALLIALAIVLRDVDANPANTIVKGIHEGANFFAGAFTDLITFKGHPKRAITINWGIALLAYLIVGGFVASVIRRIGRGGLRFERTRRTAATHY